MSCVGIIILNIIRHYECVYFCLRYPACIAYFMLRIMLPSVVCLAVAYLCKLSHTLPDLKKKRGFGA